MSELEPQIPSAERETSHVENSAEQKEKLQHLLEKAERAKNEYEGSQEKLGHAAKQEAITAKELKGKIAEKEQPKPHELLITQQTKELAYKKTIHRAQKHLSKTERTFSKVVHQPVVERASDLGAKTVARPFGLLVGGFCALLGSSFVLYMSKHYGFRYNFFVFLLFLGGGFIIGLLLEFLWNSTKKLGRR